MLSRRSFLWLTSATAGLSVTRATAQRARSGQAPGALPASFAARPSEPRARSVGPDGMLAETLPRQGGSGRFGRVGGSTGAERRALAERKTIHKRMVTDILSILSKNTQRIE